MRENRGIQKGGGGEEKNHTHKLNGRNLLIVNVRNREELLGGEGGRGRE